MVYKSPGVYRESVFIQPEAKLPTGIPAFIGFAMAKESGDRPAIVALHHFQEFKNQWVAAADGYLSEVIDGFFANGGTRCYLVPIAPPTDSNNRANALLSGLSPLEPLEDLDLVAIPDAIALSDRAAVLQVQRGLLDHCAQTGDRMALLDAMPNDSPDQVIDQRQQLLIGRNDPVNGALYYPWLQTTSLRWVPPCGHVAGIIARSDRDRGVFKAPANEEIREVLDVAVTLNTVQHDRLNPENINCLRAFPGRGIRVWGARTLSRDPNWRYLNVRRLFLTLRRWIDQNMTWATLEPNSPRLWNRIQRELTTYLTSLWRVGALQGVTPDQAFYVKCDVETNPSESRDLGQVITEIGLAASAPAEFVIVRIIHRPAT